MNSFRLYVGEHNLSVPQALLGATAICDAEKDIGRFFLRVISNSGDVSARENNQTVHFREHNFQCPYLHNERSKNHDLICVGVVSLSPVAPREFYPVKMVIISFRFSQPCEYCRGFAAMNTEKFRILSSEIGSKVCFALRPIENLIEIGHETNEPDFLV